MKKISETEEDKDEICILHATWENDNQLQRNNKRGEVEAERNEANNQQKTRCIYSYI